MNQTNAAPAAPIKTWRERIGAGADFPLHAPTDVERAMEAEIAELRQRGATAAGPALACAAPHVTFENGAIQLELTDDLLDILGRPNFTCREIAHVLDLAGVSKLAKQRAENEQASTIHYLLNMYLRHGATWWESARDELGLLAGVAAARARKGGA